MLKCSECQVSIDKGYFVKHLRSISKIIITTIAALLLAGCKVAVLEPKGVVASEQRDLLFISVLLMLLIVIPVILLVFFIATKYRASRKAAYEPEWAHNNWLEFAWWIVPCIIIIALGTITWIYTHKLDPYQKLDKTELKQARHQPITIHVVALQWRWLFIYPKQGIATINTVHFPVDTPVQFKITADAPMNSFQIPQLAGQIYAMNGMQTKLHIMATSKGVYRGQSTNFSGAGFAYMNFKAHVTSYKDFRQWVKSVKHSKAENALDWQYYRHQVVHATHDTSVHYYYPVDPKLFHKVIRQFITPNLHQVDHNEFGVQL